MCLKTHKLWETSWDTRIVHYGIPSASEKRKSQRVQRMSFACLCSWYTATGNFARLCATWICSRYGQVTTIIDDCRQDTNKNSRTRSVTCQNFSRCTTIRALRKTPWQRSALRLFRVQEETSESGERAARCRKELNFFTKAVSISSVISISVTLTPRIPVSQISSRFKQRTPNTCFCEKQKKMAECFIINTISASTSTKNHEADVTNKHEWEYFLSWVTEKPRSEIRKNDIGAFGCITVIQGHSANPQVEPTLLHVRVNPNYWKTHIYHTRVAQNCKSIIENGLWAGGNSNRGERQACYFSAWIPPDPDNWDEARN